MENQLLALFQKTGDIRAYLLWKAVEAARALGGAGVHIQRAVHEPDGGEERREASQGKDKGVDRIHFCIPFRLPQEGR